jgi:hypothetical protein
MSPWYEKSFGRDYLFVYRHRSQEEAVGEVKQIQEWLKLTRQLKVFVENY